jgi:hypothetical protein
MPRQATHRRPGIDDDAALLRLAERWFVRQGIPYFIEDYRSRTHVLPRMLPVMLLVTLTVAVDAIFAGFDDNPVVWALTLSAAALLVGGLWWGLALSRQPWRVLPSHVGWTATASVFFGFPLLGYGVGALMAGGTRTLVLERADLKSIYAVFGPDTAMVIGRGLDIAAILILAGLLLVISYVVTSYGLVPLTRRMLIQAFRDLALSMPLQTRATPVVLIATIFMFFTGELWQAAHQMTARHVGMIVGLFSMVSVLMVSAGVREEMSRIQRTLSADRIIAACEGTPLEARSADLASDAEFTALRRRQNLNMLLVLGAQQLIQAAVVALGVFLFFVVLGLAALNKDVVHGWIGEELLAAPPTDLATLANYVWITTMIKVATVLATFSGLYFVVTTVSDSGYRQKFFAQAERKLERWLAVRAAYQVLKIRPKARGG